MMTQKPQEETENTSESGATTLPQVTDNYQNDLNTLLEKLPTHSERSVIVCLSLLLIFFCYIGIQNSKFFCSNFS
jgi:hypothetical protein